MNKKMRKADEALANALAFCENVKKCDNASKAMSHPSVVKVQQKAVEPRKAVEPQKPYYDPNVRYYFHFEIVKRGKGDFRVQADKEIINKRFKSRPQAEEWIIKHQRYGS